MKAINLAGLPSLLLLAVLARSEDASHGRFLALPMRKERIASPRGIAKREVEVISHVGYDNSSYLVNGRIHRLPKQSSHKDKHALTITQWISAHRSRPWDSEWMLVLIKPGL